MKNEELQQEVSELKVENENLLSSANNSKNIEKFLNRANLTVKDDEVYYEYSDTEEMFTVIYHDEFEEMIIDMLKQPRPETFEEDKEALLNLTKQFSKMVID